jgi:hypothetical protein
MNGRNKTLTLARASSGALIVSCTSSGCWYISSARKPQHACSLSIIGELGQVRWPWQCHYGCAPIGVSDPMHVLICGGGVIGASIAYFLS